MAQGKSGDTDTEPKARGRRTRQPAASLHAVSPRLARSAAEIAGAPKAPKRPPRRRVAKPASALQAAPRPPKSQRPPLTAETFAGTQGAEAALEAQGVLPEDAAPNAVAAETPQELAADTMVAPAETAAPAANAEPAGTPALSVVVPCFDEADNLGELHRRLTAACRDSVGEDYELVLVNDGSLDDTWQQLCALAAADPAVVAVNLSRNHGQQLALSAGLRIASGDDILILDAGLQDPPELLGDLLASRAQGYDVVYGVARRDRNGGWLARAVGGLGQRLLTRMVDFDVPGGTGNLCLLSRRALDLLNAMPEQHRHLRTMIGWIGLKQTALPYQRVPRLDGARRPLLRRRLRATADAITGFSLRPLRLATWLGLAFGLAGIAVLAYALTGAVGLGGWLGAITAILLVGGVQLVMLGVVGAYVGRLYLEAKGRPLFVIDEIVRSGGPTTAAGDE